MKERRLQIIEAAYQVIVLKGYEKASIKDIAKAANITQGLVHYYFISKEEILVEVLTSISQKYSEEMQHLQTVVPIEFLAKESLNKPKERVELQPEWYKIRYELFALGLRNSELAENVDALLQNARIGIQEILIKVFPPHFEKTAPMAAIMLACFDGLALQKLINPKFDLNQTYDTLAKMVTSYVNRC